MRREYRLTKIKGIKAAAGAKTVMPGISTRANIQNNHRIMITSKIKAGMLKGSPVRKDIEGCSDSTLPVFEKHVNPEQ